MNALDSSRPLLTADEFLAGLRAVLQSAGETFRAKWAESWDSNRDFTAHVENEIYGALAAQLGLRFKATKHDPKLRRIDGLFLDSADPTEVTELSDSRIRLAFEHENEFTQTGCLDSELRHLLPLAAPLRALWTYHGNRDSVLSEVLQGCRRLEPLAQWERPLVLVVGEREWTAGRPRRLLWCDVHAAVVETPEAKVEWGRVWSDGRRSP